jgi:hypothetical protein
MHRRLFFGGKSVVGNLKSIESIFIGRDVGASQITDIKPTPELLRGASRKYYGMTEQNRLG